MRVAKEYKKSSIKLHIHPFHGPLSFTRVSWYQRGKTNLDFTEARDSEWQWHQWGHMQVCNSLQTDNHASVSVFYTPDAFPAAQPTASKHWRQLRLQGRQTVLSNEGCNKTFKRSLEYYTSNNAIFWIKNQIILCRKLNKCHSKCIIFLAHTCSFRKFLILSRAFT